MNELRPCLIHFYQEVDWIHFKYAELDALLEMNSVKPCDTYNPADRDDSCPFLRASLTEEVAKEICKRSILIKNIYELWAGFISLYSLLTQ
jgi:tRNA G10  N-methylase Trm11